MPARKPSALIKRHETAAEKAERIGQESAMRPNRVLPQNPPASLRGRKTAEAVWRRLIRMYGELEGTIITRLDMDLLVDYCLLAEQTSELDDMRKSAKSIYEFLEERRAEKLLDGEIKEATALAIKATEAFEAILKLDGRVDRKRDLMFKMRQSLYLTPRARARAAPKAKEKEQEKDPLEELLDDVSLFVNGEHK